MTAESALGLRRLRVTFPDDESRNRSMVREMFLQAQDLVDIRYAYHPEDVQVAALTLHIHRYEGIPTELLRDEIQRLLAQDVDDVKTYRERGLNPNPDYLTGRIRVANLMQKTGLLGEEPLTLPTPDSTTPNP